MIARLQTPFRAAHRITSGSRPADSGETPVLVDGLGGLPDGTSPLIGWLAERDVLLQQKEHDPECAAEESTLGAPQAGDPAAAERDVSEHEELGAPMQRHLQALDGERALEQAADGSGEPEAALVRTDAPASEAHAAVLGHLRFAPFPEGYRLVASDERCALPGDVIELEERRFVVTRVGRSPFPADVRPCAFLSDTTA